MPINIPITPITLLVVPSGQGGNGGDFAQVGGSGSLSLTLDVSVPIVGTINLLTTSANGPDSENPGNAIRRNGNQLIGLTDGTYNNNSAKGIVGN